jgi:2'-hydroxyisoflavone reductase
MKLLILGGTRFLGRHLVEAALVRGHQVTLFHRGKTAPGLFPQVEHLLGDRDGGLGILEGRRWDAAVDTCGFVPRLVRASATRLAGAVAHYTFISSISVYAEPIPDEADEAAPVATVSDPADEALTAERYGALKALCERAAESAMPGRVLNVRAGLIVGPYDYTDRFPYWPRRLHRGGEVLAPGDGEQAVQWIDARDLAAWVLGRAQAGEAGVFNVTGPAEPYTLARFLYEAGAAVGGEAPIRWVDEAFLLERGVQPWSELPLWAPGHGRIRVARALAAGLTPRPLAETVRDTLAWDLARPPGAPRSTATLGGPGSLSAEREAELLRQWSARAAV